MKHHISISKEWTKEQNEVFENIMHHWDCLTKRKVDEFLKYIHPDFVGFGHESPLTVDKAWLEHWVGFWSKNTEIPIHDVYPIHIVVHGDIAVVQYIVFTIEKTVTGKGGSVSRRYTSTWKKGEDRWQVIASHNNLMSDVV